MSAALDFVCGVPSSVYPFQHVGNPLPDLTDLDLHPALFLLVGTQPARSYRPQPGTDRTRFTTCGVRMGLGFFAAWSLRLSCSGTSGGSTSTAGRAACLRGGSCDLGGTDWGIAANLAPAKHSPASRASTTAGPGWSDSPSGLDCLRGVPPVDAPGGPEGRSDEARRTARSRLKCHNGACATRLVASREA